MGLRILRTRKAVLALGGAVLLSIAGPLQAQFTVLWEVGRDDNDWPLDGVGGGPAADFVQEVGTNPPPGNPDNPPAHQQADDDYYLAGTYPAPINTVDDELAQERAFAGTDNWLRVHFNLPADAGPSDAYRFTTEPLNLDGNGTTPRYGLIVAAGVGTNTAGYTVVLPEVVLGNPQLFVPVTTPEFLGGDVGWQPGPGVDNVVELRGVNYNADGGGNWMGLDFLRLERSKAVEVPVLSELGYLALALLLVNLGAFAVRRRRLAPQAA
jgi:hypothetical protein